MAPSVMKDAPSSQAAFPFSRSASLNRWLRIVVASARPNGGVIPAAMTAAITLRLVLPVAVAAAARPVVANV